MCSDFTTSDHECSASLVIMNVLLLKLCLAVLEQIVLWVINWKTLEVAVSSHLNLCQTT